MYYGNLLMLLLMFLWDVRKGRVMKQFVIGAVGMEAAHLVVAFLYF